MAGCGGDDADDDANDEGDTSAESGSATGTGMSGTVDPTTESTSVGTGMTGMTDPASSSSDTVADTGSETGTPMCELGACGPAEYCDFPIDDCGANDSFPSACTAARSDCEPEDDPVCGCDGIVYADACGASVVGIDVDATGSCEAPTGRFACGFRFCDRATSYCRISRSDIGGYPDNYGCAPLPEACGDAPDCTCLLGEPCADFGCAATDDGGLVIECPGG